MLQLQNGSEFHTHNYSFTMEESSQVGEARRFALTLSTYLQFDDVQQGRVSIVVNELGNNLVKYAKRGKILFRILGNADDYGIEILSIDDGPGFSDSGRVLTDGFTTSSTPGTGLGAVARQASVFDIFSQTDKGTVIVARIYADPSKKRAQRYEVGAISLPIKGETVCGDAWSVRTSGVELAAMMVDGLGHGPHAHDAATQATKVFGEVAGKQPLEQVLSAIHGRLKGTRGGAVFLVDTRDGQNLSFVGVGNIRAIILEFDRTRSLISQNGTAGVQMRTTQIRSQEWDGHGVVVLHSDGISTRWDLSAFPGLMMRHPSLIAATIIRDFTRGSDDASVLVIARAAK